MEKPATSTRWLDPDEQRVWRSWLETTHLLDDVLGRELAAATDMSMADYELLVRLSEAPERRLRMGDLAARALASRSRLSHAVERLTAAGLVSRESCPSDRRGTFAVLTDAGAALIEAAAPVHVESVRTHLFDQLDPASLASLRQVLDLLGAHLRPLSPGRAPEVDPAPAGDDGTDAQAVPGRPGSKR